MLRWQQDWGAKETHWNEKLALGQRVPEEFLDKPDLGEESVLYWTAFNDLGTERQLGMALGPIPRSAVRAYAAEIGFGEDAFHDLWSIIRTVDIEYRNLADSNRNADKPPAGKTKKPKPLAKK